MSRQRFLVVSVMVAVAPSAMIISLVTATDGRLWSGLNEHPEDERAMELFYRENIDDREPIEGPYRFRVPVDGERIVTRRCGFVLVPALRSAEVV